MYKDIVMHELKNIIFSPKFSSAFLAASILILLSVFVGIQHYKSEMRQYETIMSLNQDEMREQNNWTALSTRVVRKPDPMEIFSAGIVNDIGRTAMVSGRHNSKLTNSVYTDDPVYSIFRFIDFSFVVIVVLSLMAILFTYDLINGEKERGTLQLVFSNAVPRARFILAKLTGAWLGLVVPLLIPLLLSVLMIMIFAVPFTAAHWLKLSGLFAMSVMLFTFFIALGTLISTLTKRSQVSFLVSLVCWVTFVFILPRAGVVIAGQIVSVPSVAQIESLKDANEKNEWEKFWSTSSSRWVERTKGQENWSQEKRDAYKDEHMWQWMEEEEKERNNCQARIEKYNSMLQEDLRNRANNQTRLAFTLSRFSPVSAYQMAAMNIVSTDLNLKSRYEDAINNYKKEFTGYTEKKGKEAGGIGGVRIMMSSDGTMKIDTDREAALDLSGVPQFTLPAVSSGEIAKAAVVDTGIMLFSILLAFAISYYSFLKYDLR